MAFALAEYMGANIIAFMGQDLSFKEKLHAGDVTGLFYSEGDIEDYKRRNPIVKDIFGEERHTMVQFLGFRTSFEEAIKRFAGIVINATEGGLPIEGAQTMRLKDFLDEYCNVTITDTFETVAPLGDMPASYDLPALMAHIRNGNKKFTMIRKNAKEIIKCVIMLKELKEANMLQNDEAVKLIRKIGKREKVVEDPILKVIAPYRYRMENYLRHDEIDIDTFDAIQDSLDYYGNLIEVIDIFLDRLDGLIKTLERESKIDGILSDEALHVIDRYYQAGALHSETGMVREATKAFEKALTEFSGLVSPELQKEYWPVALKAHAFIAELYIKQHRFYEAKEILDVLNILISNNEVEIHEGGPDQETILESLNICREGVSKWEERKVKAELIFDKSLTSYGSHLESGWFYSRVGDHERAEIAYLKAIGESRSFIMDNCAHPEIIASHKIRLIGAYYGLAQAYLVMERKKDAIAVLDSGSQEIGKLISFDLAQAVEGFGALFVDLYESIGERERAEDVCQRVLTIVPNSIALKEKIQAFEQTKMDKSIEARF
jgi:tetratricopeptide (TPR) repeat protein